MTLSIFAKAFRGERASQDHENQPAGVFLERIHQGFRYVISTFREKKLICHYPWFGSIAGRIVLRIQTDGDVVDGS